MLDTLAAVYACAERFDKAVEIAQKGIEVAEAVGNTATASGLRKRLSLYQKNQLYEE